MNELDESGQEQEQALAQEIIADAQRRAERIRLRAEREGHKLVEDARKAAQAERERVLQEARARVERQRQVVTARIGQELESLRRHALYQSVERLRAEAEGELARLADSDGHAQALKDLALLAIEAMQGDSFQLILRPQDRDRWGQELLDAIPSAARERLGRQVRVEIAPDALPDGGGLVVRAADGRQMADQTFKSRMRRLWGQMCGELTDPAGRAEMAPWMVQEGGTER
jgi:vacuolar-type H+-ATPase subunit E/Vma4